MRILLSVVLLMLFIESTGQELYQFTDPASNLPAKVLSLRATSMYMPMPRRDGIVHRTMLEAGVGISKKVQAKGYLYASNMMQEKYRFEGGALSFKYRFLSNDDIHKHFRMAAFGKASLVNNPVFMRYMKTHLLPDGNGGFVQHDLPELHEASEINIDGNHSGFTAGLVATELIHKTAVSAGVAYINKWNNLGDENKFSSTVPRSALNYNVSAGVLLYPKSYTNYKQTNINLYLELLAQQLLGKEGYYLDAAPGVQFILNSTSRIDLAYRFQATGTMSRYNEDMVLLRYEYNFLNLFSKKQK